MTNISLSLLSEFSPSQSNKRANSLDRSIDRSIDRAQRGKVFLSRPFLTKRRRQRERERVIRWWWWATLSLVLSFSSSLPQKNKIKRSPREGKKDFFAPLLLPPFVCFPPLLSLPLVNEEKVGAHAHEKKKKKRERVYTCARSIEIDTIDDENNKKRKVETYH